MIIRSGTHTCERCGREYEWKASIRDPDVVANFGWLEDTRWQNIDSFGVVNGLRLIASSSCPYCRAKQVTNVVDEPWSSV